MSIENITEKILSEQTESADAVIENAKIRRDEIIKKATEKAAEIAAQASKKANEDAIILKERKTSVAELDARKMYLGAKQQAVAKCFEAALTELTNMEESRYIDFIVKRIDETAILEGEILLNKKDRSQIGDKVINMVNSSGKGRKMTLGSDIISCKGGFVLRQGPVEINATLEAIINEARNTASAEVVKALF